MIKTKIIEVNDTWKNVIILLNHLQNKLDKVVAKKEIL